MAEIIFKNICIKNNNADIVVHSAGIDTMHENGKEMMPESYQALIQCGEDNAPMQKPSTQWRDEMLNQYDYIICMGERHKRYIGDYPNVYTLDHFAGCGDIFDPYGYHLDIYIKVAKLLQTTLGILYSKIVAKGENSNDSTSIRPRRVSTKRTGKRISKNKRT
jgi:protein-tyrosine-phosphatase